MRSAGGAARDDLILCGSCGTDSPTSAVQATAGLRLGCLSHVLGPPCLTAIVRQHRCIYEKVNCNRFVDASMWAARSRRTRLPWRPHLLRHLLIRSRRAQILHSTIVHLHPLCGRSRWRVGFGLPRCAPRDKRKIPMKPPNKAPAPNRRLGFPLTALASFVYLFCALPASPAAVGEAQR